MTKEMTLTPRETEILQLVADGLKSPELEHKLGVSRHTLRTHLDHIFTKLRAENRVNAVYIAMQEGIIK